VSKTSGALLAIFGILFGIVFTPSALAGFRSPTFGEGPTKVEIQIFLSDVDSIDGAQQSFEANVFYRLRWVDRRLAHDDPNGISRPINEIWSPRLRLLNRQRIWSSTPEIVEISSDGSVVYNQHIWGSFSQPLELKNFPFDRQVFSIKFLSGLEEGEVEFVIDPDSQIARKFSLPDWRVTDWEVVANPFEIFPGGKEFAAVSISFEASRLYGYFLGKVVIPLVLIVAMSWIVFWIDPLESSSQISVAITAMLTLIAYRFAVGTSLPNVDYMTRLDLFILGATVLVFASLVQVVVTSHLAKAERIDKARRVDVWCRWLFPAIFLFIALETMYMRVPL
jgi:hypothetical protein